VFTLQVSPGPDGSPPVLAAAVLAHADREVELLFREPRSGSAPVECFTDFYADGNDPMADGVLIRVAQTRGRAGQPAPAALPGCIRARVRNW